MTLAMLEMVLETMRLSCVVAAFYKLPEWWPVLSGAETHEHRPRIIAVLGIMFALVVIAAGLPGVLMQQVSWMTPQQVFQKEGATIAWSLMLVVLAIMSFIRAPRPGRIAGAYTLLVVTAGFASWQDSL